jgi:hypothetical protein
MAIGIYYNDPKKSIKENLRSDCGYIITENDLAKINKSNILYNIGRIKAKKSAVVEFPLINSISYMLAPIKCYPALDEYSKEKGVSMYTSYELYDKQNKKIRIVMPIEE